jgi:hypothetical protein
MATHLPLGTVCFFRNALLNGPHRFIADVLILQMAIRSCEERMLAFGPEKESLHVQPINRNRLIVLHLDALEHPDLKRILAILLTFFKLRPTLMPMISIFSPRFGNCGSKNTVLPQRPQN